MLYQGPQFLWNDYHANLIDSEYKVDENSAELKKDLSVNVASIETDNYLLTCIEKFSNFEKMKRILSYVLLFINRLKREQMIDGSRLRNKYKELSLLNVEKLNKAFHVIVKMLQNKYYHNEVFTLSSKGQTKNNSKIQELDPFLDQNNLLRVGGRLKRSSLEFNVKHPLLLPKNSVISAAIVRHFHTKVYHSGRGITINEIRSNGIWIVNLSSLVRSVIWNCIECRKLRGKTVVQKMSDLPTDRITESAPFSYCGIDLFGPFKIKEKRSTLKRYGVIFTCLSSRAVHIESVNSLETDSFIMSLRRMISRRGPVRVIRCDNATNFVGADKELAAQFKKLDHDQIRSFLLELNADWCISFKRNPPYASHFGGIFERQIRSARAVLNGILLKQGEILNDESLCTVLCEVECVLNSRPLTVDTLEDPMSLQPLTPNTLLTHKTKIVIPPLPDTSFATSRKYWKRSQHLINEFWNRWKKEYLQSLQERSKWRRKRRNVRNGDIVMINTNTNRNEWPIGIIEDVKTSDDGLVRSVSVRKSDGTILMRPVSKLVVIMENNKSDKDDDEASSNEEPQMDERDVVNTSSNEEPQIDDKDDDEASSNE